MIERRQFLAQSALAALAAGWSGRRLWAAEDELERTAAEFMTPDAVATIDRGLAYLASKQHEDGSFGSGGYDRNVAVCGLSGMAFIASGSTPSRGPYGEAVEKVIGFLLEHISPSGFINLPGESTHGPMYGHGFAALFLAEVYGMTRRAEIRDKLAKAVELIINTQNHEGGWRYQPQRKDADLSVTVCQVMALRAAKNAGFHVPKETIDNCVGYVKRSQNPDGGFMYMLQGGQSQFPRSAAGVVALYSAGIYEGEEIDKGLKYILSQAPRGADVSRESHFFYGHYYAVQAMWQAGGDYWKTWFPLIRDALIARQREDGGWADSICDEYGAAMACIILQIPNNLLPIFQR